MIQIKYGNDILFEVIETPSCERVIELMSSDHVKLSWVSREGDAIPAGAFIQYSGEKFTLLDEYKPLQKSENEFEYTPQFDSAIVAWGKIPFFLYTTGAQGQILSREMDWSLTGGAGVFLDRVCNSVLRETGVTYTYSADASLPGSKNLQFSSTDILSALNSISNAFETEWWVDKANKVIHLSKCEVGTAKTLTVGGNVKTPSVRFNSEGFFNRYYAFGSTRNIVQNYTGANVNNLVNKRLTLNPDDYPNGYYEPNTIPTGGSVFSKILVFDDIYPAATNFVAYDILSRQEYVLDEATGKKIQIGTDDDGNPIYDMYAVYYIKIGTKSGSTYTQYTINAWEYSEKDDRQEGPQPGREGQLIPGLNVSVHFESGSLRGREFEVRYVKEQETYSGGGTPVIVTPGYFEIKYVKDGNYIVPDITSLRPNTDDKVILFNLRMPDEYISDAYDRLEEKMLETIEEKFDADLNLYTMASNPIAFEDDNPNLGIGSRVTFVNGDYSLGTRVTKLVSRIDFPYVQTITVGNSLVKGAIQELREEVSVANTNLEIVTALNNTAKAIADSYTRTQQIMIENFSKISEMFELDKTSVPGKTLIKAKHDGFYSLGEITAGGIGSGGSGGGGLASLWALTGDSDVRLYDTETMVAKFGIKVNGNFITPSNGIFNISTTSGTVQSVKMNNETPIQPDASGVVDLGTVITAHQSIKTINSVSLIGSGNITLATLGVQPTIDASHKLAYSLISDTPDLSIYATNTALGAHTGDTDIHITSTERTHWDAAYSHSQIGVAGTSGNPHNTTLAQIVGNADLAAKIIAMTSWFGKNENGVYVEKENGQAVNFFAYGEVTAGGVGSGGSGGTGALYTCADVTAYNNSKVGRSTTEGAQVGDLLAYDGTHWHAVVAPATGVTTFNNRSGAVSLTAGDVTGALEYTPYNAANIGSASVNYANSAGYIAVKNNEDWKDITKTRSAYLRFNVYDSYNAGGPSTYGEVLEVVGIYNHWIGQLWLGGYADGRMYYRNKDYASDVWGAWRTITFTSDIPTSLKNPYSLTFGSKTYDGSAAQAITASDLGALTSHQTVTLASGTNNGTLKITTNAGTFDNIAVKGLAALAFKASLAFSDLTSHPTTISGYGITDAITTGNIGSQSVAYATSAGNADTVDSLHASSFAQWKSYSSPDVMYDFGWGMLSGGSGSPSGSQYGAFLTMPYRKATGNTIPDFSWQIFGPNGDEPTNPDDIFVRTSMATTWRSWHKLYHSGNCNNASTPWSCSNLTASGNIYSTSDLCINKSSYSTVGPYSSLGAALTVKATGGNTVSIGIGTGGTNHGLYSDATSSWIVYMDNSNVNVPHNLIANGEITAGSDARWKHNIRPVINGIDAIMKLQPSEWEWNSDNHKGSGLVAQQTREVLPHLVKEDSEGYLHLTYDGLHAYEISAIQSHETRIERLERENKELRQQIQRLQQYS